VVLSSNKNFFESLYTFRGTNEPEDASFNCECLFTLSLPFVVFRE